MFADSAFSRVTPTGTPMRIASRRIYAPCKIRSLDMNSMLEVMAFLDQSDLLKLGAVSKEYMTLSRHPSVWRNIKIQDMGTFSMSNLATLISYTSDKMPLNSITLSGPITPTGCYCRELAVCGVCSLTGRCTTDYLCSTCTALGPVKEKMRQLKVLTVQNVKFLSSCPLNTIFQTCRNLKKVDIMNDLDVNLVISGLAANCPNLLDVRFKYPHALDFDDNFRQSHPLLRPEVAQSFVISCPSVNHISLCHYTIDEDSARCLLELKFIVEADFSDNENLSGAFLTIMPKQWVSLKKLVMRDCTELDCDFVRTFAQMLGQMFGGMLKYCHNLILVDLSCQWAFHGDSLIDEGVRNCLQLIRSTGFRWREDQCEVLDFGVDPESGIDGIEYDEEEDEYYNTLRSSDGLEDGDVSIPTAALDEALAHGPHPHPTPATPSQTAVSSC